MIKNISMKRVVVTGCGMVSPIGNTVSESWTNIINNVSGVQSYLNDPVLKNDKPYNLALVKNFDHKKWKVPVTVLLLSARQQ